MRTFLFRNPQRERLWASGCWNPRDIIVCPKKCLVVDDGGKSRTGLAPGNFLYFVGTKRRNYMELKPVKSLQALLRLSILIQKAVALPALPFFVSQP